MKMNIVIPCAGKGSRFIEAGYKEAKPFIEIDTPDGKKTMIRLVIENLIQWDQGTHLYILMLKEHIIQHLDEVIDIGRYLNVTIIPIEQVTQGAAETVLLAKKYINDDVPLMIANCDQWIMWCRKSFHEYIFKRNPDGIILTFPAKAMKWSFAEIDEHTKTITAVAEKNPISQYATVGAYYWGKGSDYVKYAEQMIAENYRVNNEFYVCPVFNYAIQSGKKILPYPVEEMWGLGTPADLEKFNQSKPHF